MAKYEFRILSESVQEYLLAIYRLQVREAPVNTSELADLLGVAPASVTGMMRRLGELGLGDHVPYKGITLTEVGRQEALRLVRSHRLWELFLTDVLQMPWDEVHEEAHRLEHATSDRLADRLAEYLEQPRVDPHGQLIPSRDGTLATRQGERLTGAIMGNMVTLLEVPDDDADLLRYLAQMGLRPGTVLEVVAVEPFGGPLTVRVGEHEHALGLELAGQLLVTRNSEIEETDHA